MKEENTNEIGYKRAGGRPRSYPLFNVVTEKEANKMRHNRGATIIHETIVTRSWLRENNLGLTGHPKQKYTKRKNKA